MIEIRVAETDAEILSCFPVMHQLRPHLAREEFVDRIRRQGESGYRLAYLADGGEVCAAAGYRFMENLASGKHLYVDDLITDEARRSRGYGDQLLAWLIGQAREAGCAMFELDSGVHRAGAHRFYFRNRMYVAAYHFLLPLDEG